MSAPSYPRGLSPELLVMIVEDVEHPADLANLTRTCKLFCRLARPKLYRRIVVTRRNADRLFRGLPRKAAPKGATWTKPEWNVHLELFSAKFRDVLDLDWEDCEMLSRPKRMPDTDPETDDERAPPVKRDPNGNPRRWRRTKRRLALCKHLTFLQMPPQALLLDIMTEMKCNRDENNCHVGVDGSTINYNSLFPNVTHLALSPRIVMAMSEPEQRMDLVEGDEPHFAFSNLLSGGAFGVPQHVCITCPPQVPSLTDELCFRDLNMSVRDMTADDVETGRCCRGEVHEELLYGRAAVVANRLPQGPVTTGSLTVHGILYPDAYDVLMVRGGYYTEGFALPVLASRQCRHRYFYAPNSDYERLGVPEVSVRQRIATITGTLTDTDKDTDQPPGTFEHIGVGRNLCENPHAPELLDETEATERIKILVEDAYRDLWLESQTPLEEDKDHAAESALADAKHAHRAALDIYKAEEARLEDEVKTARLALEEVFETEKRELAERQQASAPPPVANSKIPFLEEQFRTQERALSAAHGQWQKLSSALRAGRASQPEVAAQEAVVAGVRSAFTAAKKALRSARVAEGRNSGGSDQNKQNQQNQEARNRLNNDHRQRRRAAEVAATQKLRRDLEPFAAAKRATLNEMRAAENHAAEAAEANRRARLQAVDPPPAPVVFTDAAYAEPCVVCGGRDEGVKMGLAELREWARIGGGATVTTVEGAANGGDSEAESTSESVGEGDI